MNVNLIFVEADKNSSKFWRAEVVDGLVHCEWGRVGGNAQRKTFRGGESYLNKKVKEKLKKGYVEAKVISSKSAISAEAVKRDIGNPELEKLVEQLVKANVHKITSNSQIKVGNGAYETPLGIVTKEGLKEGRNLLEKLFTRRDYDLANEFLKVIPQKVGKSVKGFVDNNFFTQEGLQKQLELLEALEEGLKDVEVTEEKVFDLDFEILKDENERRRLERNFYDSKKRIHNYDYVKVSQIYKIDRREKFDPRNLGNHKEYYHGTSISNVLSILKSGIKIDPPSTALIAGKMFGNGAYGANCSSKSLGYSFGRWGQGRFNSGWLFVCEFAMGKSFTAGTNRKQFPVSGYDSTEALAKNTRLHNDEFIVYNNDQVKIKYLIECK